jgi:hypothetical protein
MPSMPINPLNNKVNTGGMPIPYMNPQLLMMGKRMMDTKMNLSKMYTRPCRNYHGPNGCVMGDNCHFIHDANYAGIDIPNFNLFNYKNYGNDKKSGIMRNTVTINNTQDDTEKKDTQNIQNNPYMYPQGFNMMNMRVPYMNNMRMPMNLNPNITNQNQQPQNNQFYPPNPYLYMNQYYRMPQMTNPQNQSQDTTNNK